MAITTEEKHRKELYRIKFFRGDIAHKILDTIDKFDMYRFPEDKRTVSEVCRRCKLYFGVTKLYIQDYIESGCIVTKKNHSHHRLFLTDKGKEALRGLNVIYNNKDFNDIDEIKK